MTVSARRLGAVVALVALAALSACTPGDAGAAAVVDGRRISSADLAAATDGIRTGNPDLARSGSDLERIALFYLMIGPYVMDAAQANGAGVSAQEAAAQLPKTTSPDPRSVQVLQSFLALEKLKSLRQQKILIDLQRTIAAAHPRVNPRYGRFEPAGPSIEDTQPDWFVPTPAPSAPTAGGTTP